MATASTNSSYQLAFRIAEAKIESINSDEVLIPVPEASVPLEARKLSPHFAFVVLVPKSTLGDHADRHKAERSSTSLAMFVFGDITISLSAMETRRKGELVALTLKEFNTLAYMIQNAGRVIPRDELLNQVWGYQCYPCTRTVDNHILRLRQKLETEPSRPKHLLTVHSAGYKFLP
jgi:hypothetical protein